jgi:hypothetical protein
LIRIDRTHFQDDHRRWLILRGANLEAKVPCRPDGSTYIADRFFDCCDVSFVGRPFALAEADDHFRRLKRWGLTFLRFPVSWEGIEHAGPCIYDEEYLDYICAIVEKAGQHGMQLYIDPHQDVWSRFSGGDGAPGWTFDIVGMDITRFKQVWATNGHKLAAATMFTLFFGGNVFAPATMVSGTPVQEYLQRHYVDAMKQVAMRLKGMPHVLGYETMNEPWKGYIECADLNSMDWHLYKHGDSPTAFQGMLLGSGIPQKVEVWRAFPPRLTSRRVLNPQGARVWKDGFECVWRTHGVWDIDATGKPVVLRPDYFTKVNGRSVDFVRDHIHPFYNRYAEGIRSVDPSAIIFVTPPNENYDVGPWTNSDARNIVYKPHWYDDVNWISKSYIPWLHAFVGHDRLTNKIVMGPPLIIQRSFNDQIRRLKEIGSRLADGVPTVIGETGICCDMNRKKAYATGRFESHLRVWDRIFRALDANLLSYNLWTYSAINDNVHGDHWNMEDFSIFSRDQQANPCHLDSGGRALEAIVRPYPKAVAGEPLRICFDIRRRIFDFRFRHDPSVEKPTEIFIPDLQYPGGYDVRVSDGTYQHDGTNQMLVYSHDPAHAVHTVRVSPARAG